MIIVWLTLNFKTMKTFAKIEIYMVDEKTGKAQLIAYNNKAEDAETLKAFAVNNFIKPTPTSVFDHSKFEFVNK
jgi:cytoplasmic iron level regulating protein YaaA (DUF328/UPF0246 family)